MKKQRSQKNNMNFELEIQKYFKTAFSKASSKAFSKTNSQCSSITPAQKLLKQAMFYSFKGKAGHFRPRLCFETAKALGHKPSQILPWAMALEMAHTASLIHDDMPCMDQAKIRRGQKCNHLVFGEDIALLAGSCLFIESFSLLKAPLFDKKRSDFLSLLVNALGFHGLMSGQALDLKNRSSDKKGLLNMMSLKTGVLISACALGPALLWADPKQYKALESFAKHLGLAYQLADDWQDLSEDNSKPADGHKTLSQSQASLKTATNSQTLSQDKKTKSFKTKKEQTPKKRWLYEEGLSQLEQSSQALALFKKRGVKLKLLIDEVKEKYKK